MKDFILLTGLDNGVVIIGCDLLKNSYIKTTDDGNATAIVFSKNITWGEELPEDRVYNIGDIHVKETVREVWDLLSKT